MSKRCAQCGIETPAAVVGEARANFREAYRAVREGAVQVVQLGSHGHKELTERTGMARLKTVGGES